MSLSQSQIRYLEENFRTEKEIKDMVGFFSKENRRKYYQRKKLEAVKIGSSIKDILAKCKGE